MRADEEGLLLLGGGDLVGNEDYEGERRQNMRDVHG
jgi:hypothetical protein